MKTTRRIFSAMLAIALVCCMAFTAFAQDLTITSNDTAFVKTWTAASTTQMNDDEIFNFTLTYTGADKVGTNETATPQYNNSDMTSANVAVNTDWQTNAQPTDDGKVSTSATVDYATLFDGVTFTAPGVYNFTLEEVPGDNANITYSIAKYKFEVIVGWVINPDTKAPTEQIQVLAINAYYENGDNAGDKVGGEGVYPSFPNDAVDNGNLTVSKEVTGTAANVNDYFKFTVALSGVSGTYDISYTGNTYQEGATNPETITATAEKTATVDIYLKDGESFVIENLPQAATYTVTEDSQGYEVSINKVEDEDGITTGTVGTGTTLDYVNNKDAVTPTGVFMDILPYVVMLAVVAIGAGAFVVIRRRREEEQF